MTKATPYGRCNSLPADGRGHIFFVYYMCDAFLRRCKRSGYCSPDLSDFVQLVEEGDDRLFRKIINNSSHVLHYFYYYFLYY